MRKRMSDNTSSTPSRKTALLLAVCSTVCTSLTGSALAANSSWATTPVDNTFTGANWTTGVTVPAAPTGTIADGDSLFFGTSSITTLNNDEPANFNLAGLTFNAGASAFTIGGANIANLGGAVTNNSSALQTISQRLNLTATRALTSTAGGGNLLITGIISASGSFTPQFRGSGTTTLTAANTFSGGTSEILDGSTLALDFSANGTQNNIINSGQALGVGTSVALTAQSNTLSITGSSTQSNAQTFGATAIRNMAHLNFTAGAGQTLTVNFGALTGNNGNGGASDFAIGSGVTVNVASVVNAPSTSGVLLGGGNYAMGTVNQTTWAATNATTSTTGTISAFSGYVTTPGTTGDLDVIADAQTITADQRTIRLNTAGVSTLNFTGANRTVSNGGILMTANANQNVTISDGGTATNTLRGVSNRGLYVYQYNTSNSLTIDAAIVANGTGALNKQGGGALILNKANTYTGNTLVHEGSLYVNGGVAGTSSGTGTGNTVTTARGTTLGGTGVLAPTGAPSNINNIGIAGLLSPGPATGGIGALTFNLVGSTQTTFAPMSFTNTAGLALDLGTAGGTVAAPGTSDRLNVLGTTTNTTIGDVVFTNNTINFLGTGTSDGWYKLLDSDANTTLSGLTVSGTRQITAGLLVSNLASGLSSALYLGDGTTALGTNGTAGDLNDIYLQVTSVPEPAALTLLGLGAAGVLRRRVRRT